MSLKYFSRRRTQRCAVLVLASILAVVCCCTAPVLAEESPVPDYRRRTIYFLLVDRFNARSPFDPYVDPQFPGTTNSVNCFVQSCMDGKQWRGYWGGDIAGLIEKLDYLQHLGISAVWVTPLMENVRAYEGGAGYGAGYHGYWVQNYDRVNAHFGDWPAVRELVSALHRRGMNMMLDLTLNHSNPLDNHAFGRLYRSEGNEVFVNSYKEDNAGGSPAYKHYQADERCRQAVRDNTPDYNWTDWQLQHCLLADLSGYDLHNNRVVANYLVDVGKRWFAKGVDDFRLDAIKYPDRDFVAMFTKSISDYSRTLGRPEPYMLGEWSNGGIGDEGSLKFANGFERYKTNIFDFQLALRLNRFMGGKYEDAPEQISAKELGKFLKDRMIAFNNRDDWQGIFIDNHDQTRSLVRLKVLGVPDGERPELLDLATVLLMTVRGIPVIYYGDEQYLAYNRPAPLPARSEVNSSGDDPFNRIGMGSWNETTPSFKIIKALAELRWNNPAVWKGGFEVLFASEDVLVFERRYETHSLIVAINRGEAAKVSLPIIGQDGTQYKNVLSGTSEPNDASSFATRNGELVLDIPKLGALALAR